MSILFTTGTINQPDAGSVGLAMAEKIRDDVVAHPAWELVEEFTPGAGTVRWYVFKCLMAESGYENDFFVVMARTLADGKIRFAIGESYNTSGKVFGQYGPIPSSAAVVLDAKGRHSQTFALAAAGFVSSTMNPKFVDWTPAGTSTKWWITVSEDGFSVAFNGAANGYVHLGGYLPLTNLPIDTPIQLLGSSEPYGAITRNPSVAGGTIMSNCFSIVKDSPTLGFAGDLRYNDRLQENQRPVAEKAVTMNLYASGSQADYGWAMGKHKRIRVAANSPVGFAFGDAYAMSGRLWVPFIPTDFQVWDTGVPSS